MRHSREAMRKIMLKENTYVILYIIMLHQNSISFHFMLYLLISFGMIFPYMILNYAMYSIILNSKDMLKVHKSVIRLELRKLLLFCCSQ